ncbi:hypothetical protein [Helicobacter suis]|nr:hypothetical protein [Helicobacter suis]
MSELSKVEQKAVLADSEIKAFLAMPYSANDPIYESTAHKFAMKIL